MGCKTQWNYDISCLIVASHETSFTLRGGTYAMQNDMELYTTFMFESRNT